MRQLLIALVIFPGSFFLHLNASSQDVFTRGLVYQSPEMNSVIIKERNQFQLINDTALNFDIYYPPSFDFKKQLPVVVFNNGVGSLDIPRWAIYKDWAKLAATQGLIAVNYQARPGRGLVDGEVLLDHLFNNAAALNIDAGRMGMWTCSANARTGMRLAYKTKPSLIKTLVVYYGGPDSLGQLRQDMPTLLVRAGLDAQFLNINIDNFVQQALQQDAQVEMINYVRGMHAFDAFQPTEEAKDIVVRTISFLKKNLATAETQQADYVLTNRNFMWLIMNNQLSKAIDQFRKAKIKYQSDPHFNSFYNAVTREDVLNANAYWLQNNRRQADALELFKLAVEIYPESPNAYESLSEAYDIAGNKTEAIRNAEICLQKLPAATGMNENFKQRVKEGAENRLKRLKGPRTVSQHIPPKRAHHELVYDENTKTILMTSGSSPANAEGTSFDFFNDIWRFDGKKWTASAAAGDNRSGIRMAYDSKRKKIFSYGGFANNVSLAQLRVMENGEWRTLSDNEEMKAAEGGLVYDSKRDKLVAFGGTAGRGSVNSITWEWDGKVWKKFEGNGPGPRQAFAMLYDSKRGKTVLYGGSDGTSTSLEDVWEFDGKEWKKIANNGTGPGKRLSPGFAYDSKRGMMILYGGISTDGMKGDTWGWNGTEWKLLASGGPPKRAMGYLAYDKDRDRVVLFGGRLGWPNDTNDTWEWDGKEWKEIKLLP